jgi:hypothetical protein
MLCPYGLGMGQRGPERRLKSVQRGKRQKSCRTRYDGAQPVLVALHPTEQVRMFV